MKNYKNQLKGSTQLHIFFFLVVATLLYFQILNIYAYTDVYQFVLDGKLESFISPFIRGGRAFYGLLNTYIFSIFDTVEEMRYVRLLGFTGLIASSIFVFNTLVKNGLPKKYSLATILLFISMPTSLVLSSWAATYQVLWSVFLALISGSLAIDCINKSKYKFFPVVLILNISSLLLYQPGFTAFVIPILIALVQGKESKETILKSLGVNIISYGLYFLTFKLIIKITGYESLGRAGIDYNIINSLSWFISQPLTKGLKLNFIFSSEEVQFYIFVLTSVVLLLPIVLLVVKQKSTTDKIFFVCVFSAILLSTMLPNLVSIDKWSSYRTMASLYIAICFLLVKGITYIPFEKVRDSLLGVIIVTTLIVGYKNLNEGQIDIQAREYATLDRIISTLPKEDSIKVFAVTPKAGFLVEQKLISRVVTDEFGKLSNTVDWAPEPFFKLLFKKHKLNKAQIVLVKNDTVIHTPNYYVINIEKEYLKAYKEEKSLN